MLACTMNTRQVISILVSYVMPGPRGVRVHISPPCSRSDKTRRTVEARMRGRSRVTTEVTYCQYRS